jgi:two-component sensor histidine kinase
MYRIKVIEAAISTDRSAAYSVSIVFGALVAATSIRFALADLATYLTFVSYYPAILICSLLTGWRYGLTCAGLSGIVGIAVFPGPATINLFDSASLASLTLFLAACAIIIVTADALRRAIRDLNEANRLVATMNEELQHRVANTLAVVQALASQSAKGASPEAFVTAFSGRIAALAKAHKLLGRRNLETCTLPDLIDEACQAFCDGENIVKLGPEVQLQSASCVPLVLALHELCTNAVKHGALSVEQGRVEISWCFSELPQRIMIEWKESGGPIVSKPTRKGLGSALLRSQAGIADVELRFEESGVRCMLSIDGAEPLETTILRKRALA